MFVFILSVLGLILLVVISMAVCSFETFPVLRQWTLSSAARKTARSRLFPPLKVIVASSPLNECV